jgi:hypothetical protein
MDYDTVDLKYVSRPADAHPPFPPLIEALRSLLRRFFDSQGLVPLGIRSLTPQQATGNALATEFNNSRKRKFD